MMVTPSFSETANLLAFFLFGFLFAIVYNLLMQAHTLVRSTIQNVRVEINSALNYNSKIKEKERGQGKRNVRECVFDFTFSSCFGIAYLLLSYSLTDGYFRFAHLGVMIAAFLLGKRLFHRPISFLMKLSERILSVPILAFTRILARILSHVCQGFLKIFSKIKKRIAKWSKSLSNRRKSKFEFYKKIFKINKKYVK